MAIAPGNFRRAEEASNAEGTTKAALDFALANAKSNPTPANIAIAKDTFAARQQTLTAQGKQPAQIAQKVTEASKNLGADYTSIQKTIEEAQAAIDAVNVAGSAFSNFTPVSTVVPGPTGGSTLQPTRMLASDTFRNTFALAFGKEEASKAYVGELYKLVSGFYKTGSTVDESINLAVRQARVDKTIPEFTKRFEGLFALDDMLAAGKLVDVPTVAEFIQSENEAATLLREAGMPDLATTEFIGTQVLGKGKSVAEIGRILNNAFYAIDNAPPAVKEVLATKYPTATRSGLAAALIGGEKGSAQLQKEIAGYNVVAAAKVQGIETDLARGMDLAAQGYNYSTALTGFGQVSAATNAYQKIKEMEGNAAVKTVDVQDALQKAILEKNIAEQEKLRLAAEREGARFSAKAGNLGSKSFASQARGSGVI